MVGEIMWNSQYTSDYLAHHGILGMRWGVRRYQNEDGSLTPAGKKRQKKEQDIFKSKSTKDAAKRAKENLDLGRRAATLGLSMYAAKGTRELINRVATKVGERNTRACLYLLLASVPISAIAGREVYKRSVDIAIYRKEQYEKEHQK